MEGAPCTRIIDSHALVATEDTDRYPLAPGTGEAEREELRDFTKTQALLAALDSGELAGAVLVQRNRFYGHDNTLIRDLAGSHARLRALCSVDTATEDCGAAAREWLAAPQVAGLRFMEPHKGADLGWLAGEPARAAWREIAARDALADVHLFPWNREAGLAALAELTDEFPHVPVLIDNLGNGPIEQGPPDCGLDAPLLRLLEKPQIALKFSAMTLGRITQAGLDASRVLERLTAIAGPERLLWGSDLIGPGQTPASTAAAAGAASVELSEADRAALLYGNAARLFRIAA